MSYKAYFGIKYHGDNSNRGEIEAITAALRRDGIETLCVARDIENWGEVALSSEELMRTTFEKIRESDLVILEMSEKGVGLGIEAGYAVATKKRLVVLIRHGIELSSTMQGIADAVISYAHPTEIKIERPEGMGHTMSMIRSIRAPMA